MPRLVVDIEQQRVSWLAAWDILTAELKRYEHTIESTGESVYSEPSGFHDDAVIALALAGSAPRAWFVPRHSPHCPVTHCASLFLRC